MNFKFQDSKLFSLTVRVEHSVRFRSKFNKVPFYVCLYIIIHKKELNDYWGKCHKLNASLCNASILAWLFVLI